MTNRILKCASIAAFALAFGSGLALADHHEASEAASGHDHSQHQPAGATAGQPAAAKHELSEASKAYDAAMQRMHKDMSVPYTNDVDVDFVRGMIPHHQGAIEQAEVLLKYSKNPRLRRLAGGIIAAQKREIRFMQQWLGENAKGVETGEMPEWLKGAPNSVEGAEKAGAPDKD